MNELQLEGVDGQLFVDGQKVIIKRQGITSKIIHGFKREKIIPIASVSSIQVKEPTLMARGAIQVYIVGDKNFKVASFPSYGSENMVIFTKSQLKNALAIKEFVENETYNLINNPKIVSQVVFRKKCIKCGELISEDSDFCSLCGAKQERPQTISLADEILKFKGLMDQGIITQEEFEKKKKELLQV